MRVYLKKLSNQGDTLIEVMLALSVLTLLLMTAWSLTNRATQISTAARIRTNMVNELKSQAELLKSQRTLAGFSDAMPPDLAAIQVQSNPCDYFTASTPLHEASSHPPDSFYYNVNGSNPALESGSKTVGGNVNSRVWIQRVNSDGFIDFYVQGCWRTSGGVNTLDNSIFVVRLNV